MRCSSSARMLNLLMCTLLVILAAGPTSCDERSISPGERLLAATESVGLPPLPPSRAEVYDYYRIGFFEDGYPGRRKDDDHLVPHPIYGTYVILDYLNEYKRTENPDFLSAACRVADAAIRRMDGSDAMLRFWYEPEYGMGVESHRWISGLTQAHYLDQFSRLHEISKEERYLDAAGRVLEVLRRPVAEGGVLASTRHGVVIEESPGRPTDVVLNGWLTALRGIHRYWKRTEDPLAKDLFERNVATLITMLPLYDVPEQANSRYRIRGYAYVRLELEDPSKVRLSRPTLEIPGDGFFQLADQGDNRWDLAITSGLERDGEWFRPNQRRIQLNLLLSLLSAPEPNVLRFTMSCEEATRVSVTIADGDFDPLASGLVTTRWRELVVLQLDPGEHDVEIPFSPEHIAPFVYPTNFLKRIGGTNYNAYHFIHLDQLQWLTTLVDSEVLRDIHGRWSEYPERWPAMPVYRDADLSLDRYVPPDD